MFAWCVNESQRKHTVSTNLNKAVNVKTDINPNGVRFTIHVSKPIIGLFLLISKDQTKNINCTMDENHDMFTS